MLKTEFNLKRFLNVLIEMSYLAIIFFIPLSFAIFLPNFSVFELNKQVLFRILTLILSLLVFARIVFFNEFKMFFSIFKKYCAWLTPVIIILVLSTVLSVDIRNSLYGNYFHRIGLVEYLYFFLLFISLLFFLVSSGEKRSKKINTIIIISLVSSFLVSLYGVIQIFGLDPLVWNEQAVNTGRITSTLGQPNFLASYLLLLIPLSIYSIVKFKSFIARIFFSLTLGLQLVALFFTASRGAWLAFVFVGVFLSLFIIFTKSNYLKNSRKRIVVFLLILIIAVTTLLSNSYFVNRVSSLTDTSSGSVALRIMYWQASFDAIKEKPLLGYGLENQRIALHNYYSADWGVYSDVGTIPYHAHNIILDIILSIGIVGLLAMLLLTWIIFKRFLHIAIEKSGNDKLLVICIFLSLISLFVSLLFSFNIITTLVVSSILLAVVFSFNHEEIYPSVLSISFARIILVLIAFMLISFGVLYNTNKLIADHYFLKLNDSLNSNNYFTSYILYEYVTENRGYSDMYDEQFASIISSRLYMEKEQSSVVVGKLKLEGMLDKFDTNNPTDILVKSKIYTLLGEYELAEEGFKKLIDMNKYLPHYYIEIADMYVIWGNTELSSMYLNQALEILPDIDNIYLQGEHKEIVSYYISLINSRL